MSAVKITCLLAVALSLAQINNICGSEVEMYRFKPGQSQGRLVSIVLKEVPLTEAPSSSKLNNGARPPIDLNSPRERVWCKAAIKEALSKAGLSARCLNNADT